MLTFNATQARSEWSAVCDTVIRDKPVLIKRVRDYMFLADASLLDELLSAYSFHAELFTEDNGSVTISLDEFDLVENGSNEQEAVQILAASILEYAEDFYSDFPYWARGDRKAHTPYVVKVLILNDIQKIGGLIVCRHGGI